MTKAKVSLSKISTIHYFKLIFRSILFIAAAGSYIFHYINDSEHILDHFDQKPYLFGFIWAVYFIEMILRFFPSNLESMGCQKQFARNYKGEANVQVRPHFGKDLILIAILWIILNGTFGILYAKKVIDAGILILISLAYAVCDMICILFFCPFQTWFMKNKCCGSCRIYNWDYAMMFTPLIFIKNSYTFSLFLGGILLLIRWEVTAYRHPERFSERTNPALSCANCPEKLCHHKKQLQHFLKENKDLIQRSI